MDPAVTRGGEFLVGRGSPVGAVGPPVSDATKEILFGHHQPQQFPAQKSCGSRSFKVRNQKGKSELVRE